MIKRYCDCCGDEIAEKNAIPASPIDRLKAVVKSKDLRHDMLVEVLTGIDNTANAGDFCKYCVIDALTSLDDRAKVEREAHELQPSRRRSRRHD